MGPIWMSYMLGTFVMKELKRLAFANAQLHDFGGYFYFFDSIVFKLLRCFSLYRIGSITLRKLIVFNLEATPFLPVTPLFGYFFLSSVH